MMLTASNLSCVRGHRTLFSDVSFTLSAGELLLVSGHNGAGKTSLLSLLAGFRAPDAGQVCWQGVSMDAAESDYRQQMVWLGHRNPLKPELTAIDNLQLLQSLRPHPTISITQALSQVGLSRHSHKRVAEFSAGMQRRLALASLLVCDAKLWICDEPQASLDAAGVVLFESLVSDFLASGGCVVMTSHHALNLPSSVVHSLVLGRAL
jgi:heme exporter protein A